MDSTTPELIIINQQTLYWKYIFIIFVIILLVLIAIAVFWSWWGSNPTPKCLHEDCTFDCDCQDGLICFNGTCKVPLGGVCENLDQCVSEATACYGGICVRKKLSGIGGTPPCEKGLIIDSSSGTATCKVPIGGKCHKLSDCISTAGKCDDGVCVEKKHGYDSHCSDKCSCDDGFTCYHGKCKISIDSFVSCAEDSQCADSGRCRDSVCIVLDQSSPQPYTITSSSPTAPTSPDVPSSPPNLSSSIYQTNVEYKRKEPERSKHITRSPSLSKYVSDSVDSIYRDIASKF